MSKFKEPAGRVKFELFEKISESLKIIGSIRKMSQSAIKDNLPAFLIFFVKSSEIVGSLRTLYN